MAYVAMNDEMIDDFRKIHFLNGVCRHEPVVAPVPPFVIFLNGVCRHELYTKLFRKGFFFLNGVCRHERAF